MPTPIIQTKLYIPAPRPGLIRREPLLAHLDQGLDSGHRLLLVSAPAGFGKTTLLSTWASGGNFECAWLTLNTAQNDPSNFLAYLVASLQRVEAALGEDVLLMLGAPQPLSLEAALPALINQLAGREGALVIVLDDFHQVTNPAIPTALGLLLDHLPDQTLLAIGSRADPPLPLARLRAAGRMTELRAADLRFSSPEVERFLREAAGQALSPDQVQALAGRTEGWAAGLQLAALSLKARPDPDAFIQAFSGSHRFIIDYLSEEVLSRQTEPLQDFLLQTSPLKRLCAPLVEAVTRQPAGQETLEALEAGNLFLTPLDDRRTWYRYHNLFADVMESRLRKMQPENLPGIHRRAAAWFREQGLLEEALDHALSAGDTELAAGIVESQAMALLRAGSLSTLLGWLGRLHTETIHARPRLCIASAWAYLLSGQPEKVESMLAEAERAVSGGDDPHRLEGQIAAVRCYLEAGRGNAAAATELAQRALALLTEAEATERSVVAFVVGGLHFLGGNFEAAGVALAEAIRLGQRSGNIHLAISAMSSLAELEARRGKPGEARNILEEALRLGAGSRGQPLPITASVFSGLARLTLAENDLPAARDYAQTGLDLGRLWLNPDSQVGCLLTLAQVRQREGSPAEAQAFLEDARRLAEAHALAPPGLQEIEAVSALLSGTQQEGREPHILPEPLTPREREVLALMAFGQSNRAIAAQLVIALGTAKTHVSRIMGKLNAENRTQAVARARELGLIP